MLPRKISGTGQMRQAPPGPVRVTESLVPTGFPLPPPHLLPPVPTKPQIRTWSSKMIDGIPYRLTSGHLMNDYSEIINHAFLFIILKVFI